MSCSEQWDGARIGLDGAKDRYLADDAFQLTDLATGMEKLLSRVEKVFVLKPDGGKYSTSFVEATRNFHTKFFAGDFLVEQFRVVKSENELNRMRFAADIGAQGFIDMMKVARPGMSELALASTFEGSVKKNGALWNAFPNVVGSGPNAAVIHYLAKRDLLRENELVLVDSGCEVAGGYACDITRTWGVGEKLPAGDITMYEFVLDVQRTCIDYLNKMIAAKESISLNDLHNYSVDIMMKHMLELGIMKIKGGPHSRAAMREFQKYNPTHVGHYLGMDTHDTPHVPRDAPLVPGMVITVEPGIYLPKNDFGLPEELRGIGIRIEDDIVVRCCVSLLPRSMLSAYVFSYSMTDHGNWNRDHHVEGAKRAEGHGRIAIRVTCDPTVTLDQKLRYSYHCYLSYFSQVCQTRDYATTCIHPSTFDLLHSCNTP